jgi:hypothetical protein
VSSRPGGFELGDSNEVVRNVTGSLPVRLQTPLSYGDQLIIDIERGSEHLLQ